MEEPPPTGAHQPGTRAPPAHPQSAPSRRPAPGEPPIARRRVPRMSARCSAAVCDARLEDFGAPISGIIRAIVPSLRGGTAQVDHGHWVFRDRVSAGRVLAARLDAYRALAPIVL